jgi:hypothetical protein
LENKMTQDELIDMADKAGIIHPINVLAQLEAFAKLVAAKEREACLKICEAQAQTNYWEGADVCSEEIRARGE